MASTTAAGASAQGAEEEKEMPDVTMAGTAIGTPQYLAPEQATGDTNIDFMVDIYALDKELIGKMKYYFTTH